jgi:hypothetical protein
MKINKESRRIRESVLETIQMLASPSDQLKYERDVPHAYIPGELICSADKLFHPKSELFLNAFIEEELRSLAELYGMICIASKVLNKMECNSVADMQKVAEWRSVIAFSKDLEVQLKRNG